MKWLKAVAVAVAVVTVALIALAFAYMPANTTPEGLAREACFDAVEARLENTGVPTSAVHEQPAKESATARPGMPGG